MTLINTFTLRLLNLSSKFQYSRVASQGHRFSYSTKAAMATGVGNKFDLPKRFRDSEKSVWVEYIQLALDYKPACNLGQGFPDYPPPKYVTEALSQVANGDNCLLHQYTRGFGHPRLVNAVAKLYSKLIDRQINPNTEVLITAGAYEALYSTIVGHVDEGDEVIIIEPFFDCYEPMVKGAGGKCRFIPLRLKANVEGLSSSADWVLDPKELESMFNEKTKLFILNTPNNPLGKVFTLNELIMIADLCKKWNVLCVCDEVYEWIVYRPNKHIRMASLPGMWERTITIGSAGKTFSVTGWKVGWAYGPANLMVNLQMIHQNCVYTGTTPIQEAVAISFEKEISRLGADECFFYSLPRELEAKRDMMAKALTDVGMKPVIPEGGYFMLTDWSPIASQIDLSNESDIYRDYKFTKWMTKNIGLQGIPPSAFYSQPHKHLAEDYVRYCFIKKDENIQKASDILRKWKTSKL
ncbi:hypothetical protein WA026_014682 [Henosepilachna vigintioctopunctata]|uniref:Aminotransferase class I/classII large domain-containing protein n=1 Tax=Henosepilachna vigintioctopunctata TaxID=420089 RepID=A0AAW1VGV1_9CUCU